MNAREIEKFRRLLGWYSRSWREAHGAVLLDTMLEHAELEKRNTPTGGERLAAVTHGLASRLDSRFALRGAITALVCHAAAGAGWIGAMASGSGSAVMASFIGVSAGLAFALLSVVAMMRLRGLLSDLRSIIAGVLVISASALGLLTIWSWTLGFDESDAGIAPSGFARLFVPLGLAAWIFGAVAVALIVHISRTRAHPILHALLTGVISVVAAPLIGLTIVTPMAGAALAFGVAVIAARTTRGARQGAAIPRSNRR